jgi:hypothetical protein
MNTSRRQVLGYLSALPVTGWSAADRASADGRSPGNRNGLGDDYVLVNGWILKRTEVARLVR